MLKEGEEGVREIVFRRGVIQGQIQRFVEGRPIHTEEERASECCGHGTVSRRRKSNRGALDLLKPRERSTCSSRPHPIEGA